MLGLKTKNKNPGGRTKSKIDWKKLDEFLESGSPGTEVAAFFGIHPNTLYDIIVKEKGVSFTEYCQEKKSKGDAHIRRIQFERAVGLSKEGDNTMLIWLGKQRLNQREPDAPIKEIPNDTKNDLEKKLLESEYKILKQQETLDSLQPKTDPQLQ